MIAIPPLAMPFRGSYTLILRFGEKPPTDQLTKLYQQWHIVGHNGIDYALPLGTSVLACDRGRVIASGERGDFGICITLAHVWGTSIYAHLQEIRVSIDNEVAIGLCIGLSGSTGATTGPHLHFGIQPLHPNEDNGYGGFIDPYPYFAQGVREKRENLENKLRFYEQKLAGKMKRYRGVIHESGVSEMRHNEVMILRAVVADLKREIVQLQRAEAVD